MNPESRIFRFAEAARVELHPKMVQAIRAAFKIDKDLLATGLDIEVFMGESGEIEFAHVAHFDATHRHIQIRFDDGAVELKILRREGRNSPAEYEMAYERDGELFSSPSNMGAYPMKVVDFFKSNPNYES